MTFKRRPAQDELNRRVFHDPHVVASYSSFGDPELFKAEKAILKNIEGTVRGGSILDLGVGGGRTTAHLLPLSSRYLGVDYSEPLIAACRRRYPTAAFAVADARALDSIGYDAFDLIVFSFNGIDSVSHADRQTILAQVHGRLKPGGLFWFSSHNLRCPARKPWHLQLYDWRKPVHMVLPNFFEIARNTWRYVRRTGARTRGKGYGVIVDCGHDFQLAQYYVDPAEQVRQLYAQGFSTVRIFDFDGDERLVDAMEVDRTVHVHYVAMKPR